jgi:hypothetical protein
MWNGLEDATAGIVSLPLFGPPRDIKGFEELARILVSTSAKLYAQLCRGGAPLIGGRPIVRSLAWP